MDPTVSEPQATVVDQPVPPVHGSDQAEPIKPVDAHPKRSPIVPILAALVLLGGAGVGWYYVLGPGKAAEGGRDRAKLGPNTAEVGETEGEGEAGGGSKPIPPGGLPVEVARPRRGGIERTTTQAASVHAFEHAQLYAKVSGYLKVQNVDIGDRVKLGQLLAVIDDPEVDKAVDQNKASLDQARPRSAWPRPRSGAPRPTRPPPRRWSQQAESEVVAKVSNQDLQSSSSAGSPAWSAATPSRPSSRTSRRTATRWPPPTSAWPGPPSSPSKAQVLDKAAACPRPRPT